MIQFLSVMAISAGLNERVAHIVATSAYFVDDCASREQIKFREAGQIVLCPRLLQKGDVLRPSFSIRLDSITGPNLMIRACSFIRT